MRVWNLSVAAPILFAGMDERGADNINKSTDKDPCDNAHEHHSIHKIWLLPRLGSDHSWFKRSKLVF